MPKRRIVTAGAAAPRALFVDSGAWVGLLSARDQHHAEADRLFRLAAARRIPLLTTNLVLGEVHRLLLFRAGAQAAAAFLDRVDRSVLVRVEFASADDHRGARAWLERLADHRITYTDAVSFAVMQARSCRFVLGFDGDFEAAGFGLWRPAR